MTICASHDSVGAGFGGVAKIEGRILEGLLSAGAHDAVGSTGLKLRRGAGDGSNLDGVVRMERPFDFWCNTKRVLELPVLLCGCPGRMEASREGECRRHARDGDDDMFFHDL